MGLKCVFSDTTMSDDKTGVGVAGASGALSSAQAPRLRSTSGSYATWKPDMDVYLERIGAEGVHKRAMTHEAWRETALLVQRWSDEALVQALAAVGVGAGASSSSSSSQQAASLTTEQKETRRLVMALVERSRRVFGVIWAALPDELRAQAAHVPQGCAAGLWEWLQQKFQNTEQDSVGGLLAQWIALQQQEDESFDAYRARVNTLKALLEHAKEPQSARMYQFTLLDKLQPRYKPAVLALKLSPLLADADKVSWDAVAAFINQHERTELRMGADAGSDSVSMAAGMARSRQGGEPQHGKQSGRFGAGHGSGTSQGRGGRRGGAGPRMDVRTVICLRCDEKGHFAAQCPTLGQRKGNSAASAGKQAPGGEQASAATQVAARSNRFEALSSEESDDDGADDSECTFMTLPGKAQVAAQSAVQRVTFADVVRGAAKPTALATVMQKPVTQPQPAQRATQQQPSPQPEAKPAAMKPILKQATQEKLSAAQSLDALLADDAWLWDTGASTGCSGNRQRFIELRKCQARPIKTANGSIVQATHIGSVALRLRTQSGDVVRVVVDEVLYHKSFASNLLPGEKLTHKDYGWHYSSGPEGAYVLTPGGHRVPVSRRGRVAVLLAAPVERVCSALQPQPAAAAGVPRDAAADQLVRLHERLCHMGWTRMWRSLQLGLVEDHGVNLAAVSSASRASAEKRVRECVACVQGKAKRTAFGDRGLDRGTKPGECLHLDTYPIKVERDGQLVLEHGLAMKCLRSGWVWHRRFTSKDAVAAGVIDIITQAQTQLECKVKRLYSDGGSEFIKEEVLSLCRKRGLVLQWTPARTPQLNAGAESAVRCFKDYQRTMMAHAGAPMKLWGRAAAHAAFVWNRSHVSADTGMTPYEAMRGKKPSVKHIGVWGCDAYCHVPRQQRSALAAKAEPCIYVGHNDAQNAAHVLLLGSKKIVCSRDVTFRSDSFAFMRAIQSGDDAVRGAVQECDAELSAEADQVPAQGGSDAASDGAAPSADDSVEEWTVESIVQQRKRNGHMEYKVHWAGFGSEHDSWEPEAKVSDLAALDAWEARRAAVPQAQPAVPQAQPRRSPRLSPQLQVDESAGDPELDDGEPQVHMAMVALRQLQLPEEQPESDAAMSAVASGIAALEQQTPKSYREAMAGPDGLKWKAAIDKELKSCEDKGVWSVVPRSSLPPGTNVLPCKDVFKVKLDERGEVTEHKARVTPKGFRQQHGKDFFETFARTGQYKTLRVALSLVAKWDHELAQFDVPTAFLNADLEEDVYMEMPEAIRQPGMVCKLHKSLYGLKQAPRNWDRLVHTFITGDMAWRAAVSDPSFYFKRSRSGRLMLIYRFVDDMQGSYHADDAAEFAQNAAKLQERFNIKQLRSATWMLGMRISRDRKARTITLDQELYVTKALERYGLQQCRVVSTPEAVGAESDAQPELEEAADRQRYMEITGTLMYAAISTRPDIAHAVHRLASNMQTPKRRDLIAAERVLRYLAGTKDVGLVFGSRNGEVGDSRGRKAQVQVDVCAFADADWANNKGDRRSVTGWAAKLNGDVVSWAAKKQRVVALSTCEAELYAEAAAIQEVLWLRGLMEELGLHTRTGSIVYGDNQSAISVSQNGVKGERTKHVDVKYHFVTETVERGIVKLCWVPTTQQQADIFTKALATPVFELLRSQLMSR